MLGIGGIGMSALAKFFLKEGHKIWGYDASPSELTTCLEKSGAHITYEDNPSFVPSTLDLTIYTPAIPSTLNIFTKIKTILHHSKILKRSQALSHIVNKYPLIAVAGTHGKTTITSMIIHCLLSLGYNVLGFAGGIMKNYNTNFIYSKNPHFAVVEADEYDKALLDLTPSFSIISYTEYDHTDIYTSLSHLHSTFKQFLQLPSQKIIIVNDKVHHNVYSNLNVIFYGNALNKDKLNSYKYLWKQGEPISTENSPLMQTSGYLYCTSPKIMEFPISLSLPGEHIIENACASFALLNELNLNSDKIINALKTFSGVKRRLEVIHVSSTKVIIDDYAHHPTEIKATIRAVKKYLKKPQRIIGVFQPHLYTRTRDLMDEFAESFHDLDAIYLAPIYPAREEPIPGIQSNVLLSKISKPLEKYYYDNLDALANALKKEKGIILIMSAGNLNKIIPSII